jgi:L-fuconolactonase
MYLDSHIHFWDLSKGYYQWIKPDNSQLYRNYLPEHVQTSWDKHQVKGAIVVQAASNIEETEFMLKLAKAHETIKGVVGWMDVTSESFLHVYEACIQKPKFVGFRINLNGLDEACIEQPLVSEHFKRLEEDQLPVDLMLSDLNLPVLEAIYQRVPHLKAVINHLGNPPYKVNFNEEEAWKERYQAWQHGLEKFSHCPHLYCKLSGMISQIGGYKPEEIESHVQFLIEVFGTQRLMFGSDWPVSLKGGSYDDVVKLFEEGLPQSLTYDQRNHMRHLTAEAVYGV